MTKTTLAFPLSMDLRLATIEASGGLRDTFIIDANKHRVMTVHEADIIRRKETANFIVGAVNAVARAMGLTASALAGVGTVIHDDDLGVTVIPMKLNRAEPAPAVDGTISTDGTISAAGTVTAYDIGANKITAKAEAVMRAPSAPDLSANGILRMILRTATTELENPRCDLLEAIKCGAREVEAAIRRDREIRQEERDAALRDHIVDVERMMASEGLGAVIRYAISNFSSPTTGAGSIHGGQHGYIIYEHDGVPFVAQAVCEAVMMATRKIAERLRDGAFVLTAAELQEIAQELACLPIEPPASPSAVEPKRWSTPALAWVVDTFGSDQGYDQHERATRFLEEAIEVGHVLGVSFGAVSALVTRTYLKPPVRSVSNIRHELGQAEFTLALLVELFAATPPGYLGEREFHRVRGLGNEFWRARHAAKVAGIESVASMAGVASASDTIAIRDATIEECVREIAVRPDPADLRSSLVAALRALKTKR